LSVGRLASKRVLCCGWGERNPVRATAARVAKREWVKKYEKLKWPSVGVPVLGGFTPLEKLHHFCTIFAPETVLFRN
jgi:hypothetical protein